MNEIPDGESMTLNHIPHLIYHFAYQMVKGFKPSASETLKLNKTHGRTMMVLHKKGSRTMTELVQDMNIEKGSMTTVVDSLIEKKLAVRERDGADRRRVIISLTRSGAELSETISLEMHNFIKGKLDQLGDQNKDAIIHFTATIRNCLDIWENQIET